MRNFSCEFTCDCTCDYTWRFGANFIPSNAINQLEMWQDETFSLEVIKRELGYAKGIGMNIMRVFLHDLLWEDNAESLLSKMDKYLSVSDELGIKTMFVFFDDCWNDRFALGKQPEPIPFTHNSGWLKSPGTAAVGDLSQRKRLEKYVKGVLTHFADDNRIVAWDLYNEPKNCNATRSLLLDVFKWAREVSPSQPYTVGMYQYSEDFGELNDTILKYSDIVTFHCYGNKETMADCIAKLKERSDSRGIICTEYMARHMGSTFGDILPILKDNGIGAVNWGLVSGKTQTIYPWDSYKEADRYAIPFHDVFSADGALLVPAEAAVFSCVSSAPLQMKK